MKIFVDGEEWERTLEDLEPGTIIIRPIKPEPKWEVELRMSGVMNPTIRVELFDIASVDQAQLIKQKITNLIEEMDENGLL